MSVTNMVSRWLAERWAAGVRLPRRNATDGSRPRYRFALTPLQWRAPWLAWQIMSWVVITLLAPTFWVIGILLTINAHSDQPFFWPALMAVVALTNAIAIVHTNQRHHRRRFTGHRQVALHYLGVSLLAGGALFLLLAWSTGVLGDFAAPIASAVSLARPLAVLLTSGAMALGFGLLSFAHASVLHAWLAFEA